MYDELAPRPRSGLSGYGEVSPSIQGGWGLGGKFFMDETRGEGSSEFRGHSQFVSGLPEFISGYREPSPEHPGR